MNRITMYQIRVWKYLDDNTKELKDLVVNDNIDFMKLYYKELKELYDFWNYEIEKVGF